MLSEELERLIEVAYCCQREALITGDSEEAAYQEGRIDAWQQLIEEV